VRLAAAFLLAFSAGGIPFFENIASISGLTHSMPNGGEQTKRYIIETTGSGTALVDYNNDGWLDALLLSGPGGSNRLYRNSGRGKFVDVTAEAGLTRSGWAQGVCAGDYDNDGWTDLFLTYWGRNVLYRNGGGVRFEDITEHAGLIQDRVRYNTGCAFLDYDRDGDLDLFVANYLQFGFETTPSPGANPYCWYRGIPVNCGPRGLPFDRNILYRNDAGIFKDVSAASGVAAPGRNYSLGVLTADFDNDGWTDIYVACDQTPSILYVNRRDGTFRDEALLRGAALDENGKALSGMGAAAADYDGNGWVDIFRTNFSDERETLYRNLGNGDFEDATQRAAMAKNTRFVGWGAGFFDIDNDGWKDLLLVNGHVFPEVDKLGIDIRYKDRAILYRNTGDGSFTDISEQAGPGMLEHHSSRGAAFGDIDNDGAVEVLINNQNEPPSLLRMREAPNGNWVSLKLAGSKSNKDAIGARLWLTAQGRTQIDEVRSGGSYLSQSDLRLHFGAGKAKKVDVRINWPSGCEQKLEQVAVNQVVLIREECGKATDPPEHRQRTRSSTPRDPP
jgi:hypothetical protein